MNQEEKNEYSDLIQESLVEQSGLNNKIFENFQDASPEDLKMRLEYCKDILDKRYSLYTWLDTKVNLSLAINSALLGFSYILLNKENEIELLFLKIMILLAIFLIGISIFI